MIKKSIIPLLLVSLMAALLLSPTVSAVTIGDFEATNWQLYYLTLEEDGGYTFNSTSQAFGTNTGWSVAGKTCQRLYAGFSSNSNVWSVAFNLISDTAPTSEVCTAPSFYMMWPTSSGFSPMYNYCYSYRTFGQTRQYCYAAPSHVSGVSNFTFVKYSFESSGGTAYSSTLKVVFTLDLGSSSPNAVDFAIVDPKVNNLSADSAAIRDSLLEQTTTLENAIDNVDDSINGLSSSIDNIAGDTVSGIANIGGTFSDPGLSSQAGQLSGTVSALNGLESQINYSDQDLSQVTSQGQGLYVNGGYTLAGNQVKNWLERLVLETPFLSVYFFAVLGLGLAIYILGRRFHVK